MTDLDDLPFDVGAAPATPTGARPKPHRHTWFREAYGRGGSVVYSGTAVCERCGKVRDEEARARGKSARRLGGDQERRIERVYGPEKIGERGDAVDHIGRIWKWQSKATRSVPPLWLAAISEPTERTWLAESISDPWNRMRGLYGGRRGVVIRSFVRPGVRPRDWLFIQEKDAAEEFAMETKYDTEWVVIPGDWWLDHFGRDE